MTKSLFQNMKIVDIWRIYVGTDQNWIFKMLCCQMTDKQIRSVDVHKCARVNKTFWSSHQRIKSNNSVAASILEHFENIRAKTCKKVFLLFNMEINTLTVREKRYKASNFGCSLLFQCIYCNQKFDYTVIDLLVLESLDEINIVPTNGIKHLN